MIKNKISLVRNNKNEYVFIGSIFIFCFFECPSVTLLLATPAVSKTFSMMMLLFIISLSRFSWWLSFHYCTLLWGLSWTLSGICLTWKKSKIKNSSRRKSRGLKKITSTAILRVGSYLKYSFSHPKIILLVVLFIGISVSFV